MQVLPFLFSFVVAVALVPLTRTRLVEAGMTRENYRGSSLPVPIGVAIVPAALIALIPLMLIFRLTTAELFPKGLELELPPILAFISGVALLGFIDDVMSGESRGWRGHASTALEGGFSTGLLKACGTLGLALLVASLLPGSKADFFVATAVLVLAVNAFNLLDLRPGRSVKAFVLLGIGLLAATQLTGPPAVLGLFIAPVLVVGFYDLREKAMLGDAGSNVIGAIAGIWLVLALEPTEQLVALAILIIINLYGEFRSLSKVIEKTPGIRQLDSFGRPS